MITGFAHNVVARAFSADGKLLGVAGGEPTVEGEVKVFQTDDWKQIMDVKNGHSDTVYGLCFSPDAKMLATGSADRTVSVWNPKTGRLQRRWAGFAGAVRGLAFSPDGTLLAAAAPDPVLKLWDPRSGIEAGRRITEICMGGLGQVSIATDSRFRRWRWMVEVGSMDPVLACLASQLAGWSLSHGEGKQAFFALGSGPGRACGQAV